VNWWALGFYINKQTCSK